MPLLGTWVYEVGGYGLALGILWWCLLKCGWSLLALQSIIQTPSTEAEDADIGLFSGSSHTLFPEPVSSVHSLSSHLLHCGIRHNTSGWFLQTPSYTCVSFLLLDMIYIVRYGSLIDMAHIVRYGLNQKPGFIV